MLKSSLFFVVSFTGSVAYLLSTSQHVMVEVGSQVNFSCRSSILRGISWYFKNLDSERWVLLNTTSTPDRNASVLAVYDVSGHTKTLLQRRVTKRSSGTYKCVDANDEASAQLTVVDTGQSGGLTLCPEDVVTTSGESVVIRVAGKRGSSLRWYRRLHNTADNPVIYTGRKMDYKEVDERYAMTVAPNEEQRLNILEVKSTDAGLYTVREEFSRQVAEINLVVIEPDSLRCRRETVSEANLEFICDISHTGFIEPTVKWFGGSVDKQLETRVKVPAADPASWPRKCQITFSRQSCNQPRASYTRTAHCVFHDSQEQTAFMAFLARHYLMIIISLLVALVVVVVVMVIVLCTRRKCKSATKIHPEYLAEPESESTSAKYEHLPNQQFDSPPQYETIAGYLQPLNHANSAFPGNYFVVG